MKLTKWLVPGLICATLIAADAPRGTVPRATAEKYTAHAEKDGITIGATLLKDSEARKAFSTPVTSCCIVVEVALYPQKDGLVEISLNDFALRVVGQDIAAKPTSAELVAGRLYRRTQPEPDRGGVTISPTGGIGYETGGIDPITGQRRPGGVITSGGVGVGVPIGGHPQQSPESTDVDRRTMELELREKSLPEGNTASPVAGYVYFSMQQKKNTKYQIEYLLNGEKIILPL